MVSSSCPLPPFLFAVSHTRPLDRMRFRSDAYNYCTWGYKFTAAAILAGGTRCGDIASFDSALATAALLMRPSNPRLPYQLILALINSLPHAPSSTARRILRRVTQMFHRWSEFDSDAADAAATKLAIAKVIDKIPNELDKYHGADVSQWTGGASGTSPALFSCTLELVLAAHFALDADPSIPSADAPERADKKSKKSKDKQKEKKTESSKSARDSKKSSGLSIPFVPCSSDSRRCT